MDEIKEMKGKCHEVFDSYWQSNLKNNKSKHRRKVREQAYIRLTTEMRLAHKKDSHFRNMNDIETLQKAYDIVLTW